LAANPGRIMLVSCTRVCTNCTNLASRRSLLFSDFYGQKSGFSTVTEIQEFVTETVFKEKHGVWDPMPELTRL
jgi:hypothetical protein